MSKAPLSTSGLRAVWGPPCSSSSATFTFWTGCRVTCDPRVLPALAAMDAIMRRYGYAPTPPDVGMYVCRPITGGSGYSLHAYKIAVDVNWQCLHGDTEVVTWDGVQRIEDLAGTTAKILTRSPTEGRHSRWVEAEFLSFGEATFDRVVLSRRGIEKEVLATPKHRWFQRRNHGQSTAKQRVEEVVTADLAVGDRVVGCLPPPQAFRTNVSPIGVAAGNVYGDGTLDRNRGSAVDLFGSSMELLRFYPEPVVHPRTTAMGEPGLHVSGLPGAWKRPPDLDESASYLLGWLAGYFAADGSVARGTATITSAQREHLDLFRHVAMRVGIACNEPTVSKRSGFGADPSEKWAMSLVSKTVPEAFFVRGDHREKFVGTTERKPGFDWKVERIERAVTTGESYCPVVPETGAFALGGWILTGNSNPYFPYPAPYAGHCDMPIGMVNEIVGLRTRSGAPVWGWGGYYRSIKDYMHYEIVCTPQDLASGIVGTSLAPAPLTDDQKLYWLIWAGEQAKDKPVLGKGMVRHPHRRAVKQLQKALGIAETGVYGPGTRKAVKQFQAFLRMPVTGIVDERTWQMLIYTVFTKGR